VLDLSEKVMLSAAENFELGIAEGEPLLVLKAELPCYDSRL
jgi:hypothetical protein